VNAEARCPDVSRENVSTAWGEPWPALGFWVLTLAKYPGVALALGSATGEWVARRHWLTMVAFYVLAAAVTALVPVPRLGVTDLVVRAQGLGAGGLWAREPQRVLAFGFVYFVALGVFEGVRNAATLLGDTERGRGEWGIEPA